MDSRRSPRRPAAYDTSRTEGSVHLFVTRRAGLEAALPEVLKTVEKNGVIHVLWPERSSGIKTDLREQTIRDVALLLGLEDIRSGDANGTWSRLRLVNHRQLQ
ncbi:hypothetical protein CLV78_104271 [Aliiruegeria haliotis]|uniref:DUF3052 family protein n=1 Tax=Aliiruegeria haliotis TaxID=1280846 RepID=A0A2T0RRF4_9RHOB|nr:hypothetical protein [Aliiruegeria haliotis]PRY23779.1 hypothetical protein CLV78_104271 [Aliiruegeria haliotis]